ncbi:MAG: hypothetical protein R3C13_14790 [Hyphomonas sp.]
MFWTSTLTVEIAGGPGAIAALKQAILWGMLVLIPALALTGFSGMKSLSGPAHGLASTKLRRMPFIAGNGILVLIPSAVFLHMKASTGAFDTAFYAVQAVELVAGAINLTLLGLNLRDGLRMTRRRRQVSKR